MRTPTPDEEHRTVRERVGLIDVSTLGKLEVRGKDAARLLDTVYTHTFSTLRVGRIRYGVMCDDSGIIIDDGTVLTPGRRSFLFDDPPRAMSNSSNNGSNGGWPALTYARM